MSPVEESGLLDWRDKDTHYHDYENVGHPQFSVVDKFYPYAPTMFPISPNAQLTKFKKIF